MVHSIDLLCPHVIPKHISWSLQTVEAQMMVISFYKIKMAQLLLSKKMGEQAYPGAIS